MSNLTEKKLIVALQKEKKHLTQKSELEPIAVAGMGCRFPGDCHNTEDFWQLLLDKKSGITTVPQDRFPIDEWYSEDNDEPGKIITSQGSFIDNIDLFDARFFGIAPKEAKRLDPQHRLLLEVAWETLENAGVTEDKSKDLLGGVFIGLMGNDYFSKAYAEPEAIDAYTSTGTQYSFAANRISFHLDLMGPSMAIDTACSSSLVAVHQACQNLRLGDCDFAIAGGVNLIISPVLSICYSKWGMLSPDGLCKTFDEKANGFVRGEGAGLVLLKRLKDARKDGDKVLAVIKGSAVNQDGATSVITAPNGLSQQNVIKRAVKQAGIKPSDVGYIETHGTGTPVGDSIEVDALKEIYGSSRGDPCYLGAVKTNIGHLEGAAGIAGFIKAVLCVHHGFIPGNLNFENMNPLINLTGSRLQVASQSGEWTSSKNRVAAVSSFGAGGTNAHVIIAQAPCLQSEKISNSVEKNKTVLISAKNEHSLKQYSSNLIQWLRHNEGLYRLADIAYTLNERRDHFNHRLTLCADSVTTLKSALENYVNNKQDGRWFAAKKSENDGRIAFVFSGHGSQWFGMGRELIQENKVFHNSISELDLIFIPLSSWSIVEMLSSTTQESILEETQYAQPCIFAIQVALVECLKLKGLIASAVIGYSVGEIAAAYVSGRLTKSQAVQLVYHRSVLMQKATGLGKMASVGLSYNEVKLRLNGNTQLAVAAVNGPRSVVVSGDTVALENFLSTLRQDNVFVRLLSLNYAFHSHQLEQFKQPLIDSIEPVLNPNELINDSTIPMVSTVTGVSVDAHLDACYWADNARKPVLFMPAVEHLVDCGYQSFLEIGPHPISCTNIEEYLKEKKIQGCAISTLERNKHQGVCLDAVAGKLYSTGAVKKLNPVTTPLPRINENDHQRKEITDDGSDAILVPLPNYAWDHQRYWIDTKEKLISDWVYEHCWDKISNEKTTTELISDATSAKISWLLIGDKNSFFESFTNVLVSKGHSVESTRCDVFDNIVNLQELLHEFEVVNRRVNNVGNDHTFTHVVFLARSSCELSAQSSSDQCLQLINLTKLFQHSLCFSSAKLWIVTQKSQCVTEGDQVNPFASSIWGIGRVLSLEHAAMMGGLIDLESADTDEDINDCLSVILQQDSEDQCAIRNREQFNLRLLHCHGLSDKVLPISVNTNAKYLITGGTGGLGLNVAQRLVKRGVRHLLLMGRTPLPERSCWVDISSDHRFYPVIQAIKSFEGMGVTVDTVAVDVANEQDMAELFNSLKADDKPLKGIVHAAGILVEQQLLDISKESLESTLRPKITGTWLLHQLSENLPLEFFIMFSSAASVWGASGLAHYAAANEFLNTMSAYRNNMGLPALTVCWGMWSGNGIATEAMKDSWHKLGLYDMQPEPALDLMESLSSSHHHIATVANVDWQRFKPIYSLNRERPLLQKIILDRTLPKEKKESPELPSGMIHDLSILEPEQQKRELLAFLVMTAAKCLDRDDIQTLLPDQGLFEMGFDSLITVEFCKSLSQAFVTTIETTLVFDCQTLNEISEYLIDTLFAEHGIR